MAVFVRANDRIAGLLSLVAAWIALWTREDSLAVLLIMPVLFLVYYCRKQGISSLQELLARTKTATSYVNWPYVVYFSCLFAIVVLTSPIGPPWCPSYLLFG